MSTVLALADVIGGRTAGTDGYVRLAVDAGTWAALAEGCAAGRHDLGARHQALDALVHVAQPFLEAHDRLAVGGEAEVAGLDDAGMNRPDRYLVQPLAFGRQELVARHALPAGPATVIEPRPGIGQADRLHAVEVAHGALQTKRRQVTGGDRGIPTGLGLERDDGAHAAELLG